MRKILFTTFVVFTLFVVINQAYAAVSVANLTSGASNDTATSTTASITPSANKLILLTVGQRTNITANPNLPDVSGNGLTWVVVTSTIFDSTGGTRRRITMWRAMGASPSTDVITIAAQGQANTHMSWAVEEFTGMDTTGTNGSGAIVQSAANVADGTTSSTLTVTLGAFSNAGNATYGGFSNSGGAAMTPGSGFATSSENLNGGAITATTEFKNTNDTTVDGTWALAAQLGGVAVEIAIPAAATPSVTFTGTPQVNFRGGYNTTFRGSGNTTIRAR